MKNKERASWKAMLFATVLLCALPFGASAQSPNVTGTFVVRPSKVEVTVLPGQDQVVTLRLSNGTPVPLRLSATFEDVASQDQGTPMDDPIRLLGDQKSETSARDMFSISRPTFELLSGNEVDVPIRVTVPAGTLPGGRYGSVVFSFKPALSSGVPEENIAVESRIAVIFFVRVAGVVHEEGKLVKFGLFNDERFVASPSALSPLRFQVAYENTGEVYENPHGTVTVTGWFGRSAQILVDPFAVLPGATRMREVDLFTPFPIGSYSASLSLARGYGDAVDTARVSFVVLPTVKEILVSIGVLVALWFVIRRSLRISRSRIS